MTNLQERFFDLLDEYEWDIFSRKMLISTQKLTNKEITQALRTLTKSGSIVIIEKEKYRRKSFLNEYVIGNFLVPDGGFAYWTALNMHGLTEQFSGVKFLQTSRTSREFVTDFGETYKFVKVKSAKIIGYQQHGVGNHQYKITDLEKTIVDCFDLPQYSGGYPELIRAFYRTDLQSDKLKDYCLAANNISVIKRLAYLSELLKKKELNEFVNFALTFVNKRYTLIDPMGNEEGKFNKRWKIRLNVPENDLILIAKSIY
ncbi:MAG: hypothetical protein PHP52_12130 [Bacteroidales bacterium]|nr:hypothetical protein [Bacteroidales bacterium]MDD4218377.1 hypothetical protein [Bacteroidales bacterium]MDY0141019.1 hypothetical protein [Bacteroidales bacterium]